MLVFFLSRRAPMPEDPLPEDALWLGPPAIAEGGRSRPVLGGGASSTSTALSLVMPAGASEATGTPAHSGAHSDLDIRSVDSPAVVTPARSPRVSSQGAAGRLASSSSSPHLLLEGSGAPGAIPSLTNFGSSLVRALCPRLFTDGGSSSEGGSKRTSLDGLDSRTGELDSTTPRRNEESNAVNGRVSSAGPTTPAYGPMATPGRPSESEDIDATIAYINKAHYISPALNDLAQPSPRSSSGRFRLKRTITRSSLQLAAAAPPLEGGTEPLPGGAPSARALSGAPTRSPSFCVHLGERAVRRLMYWVTR